MDKKAYIESLLSRLKIKAIDLFHKEKIENTLSLISVYCSLQYQFNQIMTDKEIEELLDKVSFEVLGDVDDYKGDKKVVLFYDGFGLDLRGWAASYIKALNRIGYKIVYITKCNKKNRIPHILKELDLCKNYIEYIDTGKSYTKWIYDLYAIFIKYKPRSAFFYTTPNDVSGAVVFNRFKNKI